MASAAEGTSVVHAKDMGHRIISPQSDEDLHRKNGFLGLCSLNVIHLERSIVATRKNGHGTGRAVDILFADEVG